MTTSGCSTYKSLLAQVPDNVEFETFRYHRGGNVTSATVAATGGKVNGNTLSVDDVHITLDYGPFVSFDVKLTGYKRTLETNDKSGN